MKLIVGLGNPGKLYVDTRHNIGFCVVKTLARIYKVTLKKDSRTFSLSAKADIDAQAVVLATPFTYMNLSGIAVRSLLKKYRIDLGNLLVVCDDLDLELGRLKIRPGGSSGGHRGLASIRQALESQDFARLRVGIGRPLYKGIAADYVLSNFTKKEKTEVGEIIERAVDCCRMWLNEGLARSMNTFNRKE